VIDDVLVVAEAGMHRGELACVVVVEGLVSTQGKNGSFNKENTVAVNQYGDAPRMPRARVWEGVHTKRGP
jgi:hypothetical protein